MLDTTAEEVMNKFSPEKKFKEQALITCQSEPPKKSLVSFMKPEMQCDNMTNLTPVTKESTNDAARR